MASATAKTRKILGLVIVVLVAVGALVFLNLRGLMSSNNSPATASQTKAAAATLSIGGFMQPGGLLNLFGNFSHMQVSYVVTNPDEAPATQNATYAVLGHVMVNSTDYYRVQFTTLYPGQKTTTLWFDQRGNVSVAEVKGDRNYTGFLAGVYSVSLTSLFAFAIVGTNATHGLQMTGNALQYVGPTQLSVSAYQRPSSTASTQGALTLKIATIPGTNISLITYVNAVPADPEASSQLFQVISVSRG